MSFHQFGIEFQRRGAVFEGLAVKPVGTHQRQS